MYLFRIWILGFETSYLPWAIIITMCVLYAMKRNSSVTQISVAAVKERAVNAQLDALGSDIVKKDKVIARLRAQQMAAEEAKAFLTPR
jgi:hypothetical protein